MHAKYYHIPINKSLVHAVEQLPMLLNALANSNQNKTTVTLLKDNSLIKKKKKH